VTRSGVAGVAVNAGSLPPLLLLLFLLILSVPREKEKKRS
jgi:hypothetical protein